MHAILQMCQKVGNIPFKIGIISVLPLLSEKPKLATSESDTGIEPNISGFGVSSLNANKWHDKVLSYMNKAFSEREIDYTTVILYSLLDVVSFRLHRLIICIFQPFLPFIWF